MGRDALWCFLSCVRNGDVRARDFCVVCSIFMQKGGVVRLRRLVGVWCVLKIQRLCWFVIEGAV